MFDRKQHWEKVYSSKSPFEVSWYEADPELSLRLINDTGVERGAAIIDVGGGASNLVAMLSELGYQDLSVLDISANALAQAKLRMKDADCDVHWYEEDITRFEPPRKFDLWHDRAVFHFLTSQEDRDSYVAVLKKALAPGSHLVIMTFAIDGPVKCSGLDIVQYDSDKMLAALGEHFKLVEEGVEIHTTPAGGQQKFVFFRFKYMPIIR